MRFSCQLSLGEFFTKEAIFLGNLAIELSDINDEARNKLVESYKKIEQRISFFLGTLKQYHSEEYSEMEPELYARWFSWAKPTLRLGFLIEFEIKGRLKA